MISTPAPRPKVEQCIAERRRPKTHLLFTRLEARRTTAPTSFPPARHRKDRPRRLKSRVVTIGMRSEPPAAGFPTHREHVQKTSITHHITITATRRAEKRPVRLGFRSGNELAGAPGGCRTRRKMWVGAEIINSTRHRRPDTSTTAALADASPQVTSTGCIGRHPPSRQNCRCGAASPRRRARKYPPPGPGTIRTIGARQISVRNQPAASRPPVSPGLRQPAATGPTAGMIAQRSDDVAIVRDRRAFRPGISEPHIELAHRLLCATDRIDDPQDRRRASGCPGARPP